MPVFSSDSTAAQIRKLEQLPVEEGGIGVVAQNGDVGVVAAASKDIGKGWTVRGSFAYMKDAGYSAAAWLGWKGTK